MMQTIVAHTKEIDDVELAVREILEQIRPEETLKKNAVGILSCHYEFAFTGVVEALQEALPFDLVGTVSPAQATPDMADILLLTILVLTSDDVCFRTSCSESLLDAPAEAVAAAYEEAAIPGERPALVLPFTAFLPQNSGDEYVSVLSKISGGVPCFGTLAVDDTSMFENCFMIYKGQRCYGKLALLLIYGDVSPKFYVANLSLEKLIERPVLITKSRGHILEEVNGRSMVEFFEAFGLAEASEISYAMSSIQFMLDYGDGTPLVARVFIAMDDDRNAIFAGHMPEGAAMYMGMFDKEDVLATSSEAMKRIMKDSEGASGALVYSCVSRFMSLGSETLAELTLVMNMLGSEIPFMAAYAGGEICPTDVSGEKAVNRFHNDSFVVCVF